ncbi:hypothetical protein KW847_12895 [Acidovorax sp. sif0715]|nr:hypothetical protein [Acidovorax sp. sif0732]MBV7450185.1 hypothetical protein [Acidovorax sp. sif0715]
MLHRAILSLECAHTMRRLLLVFLLLFMPLQFIWAAASPYCGHEAAPQASHFGHHVHEHRADVPAEPSHASETQDHKALATTGTADMDCHACHGVGSGMALSAGAQAIVVSVARPVSQVAPAWVHPPLSRPERPNWSVLA